MISIYPPSETLFADNGLKILKPLKALIYKEDNSDYYLDLRDDLENLEYYQSGNIVKVPTPWGKQCFRLKNPQIENKKINVRARHLYFDSQNYIIKDSFVVDKNCNDALDHLNRATDVPTPFTTISDVPTIFSYRCVRKSLAEAVNDVIERWGGHLVRNNWQIEVRQNAGQDRGVNLVYGKNIVNITSDENWSSVCTKLMPVGKDGLLLDETWLSIDEQLYDIPYTKVVSFEQNEINQKDYSDGEGNVDEAAYQAALINDLRAKGLEYLNENSAPKVNYTLDAYLKNVSDVGDTIFVKHPKCRIDIITRVIALEFDVIRQQITKVEFGNFKNNLKNLLNTVENKITEKVEISEQNVTAKLEKELLEATNAIKDRFESSYVVYEKDQILILDAIPKETAQNVIRINSGGIGFSSTGINGIFNSAWTIDGTLDMQQINVINLVADLIKGGTLKLGNFSNQSGIMELYDESNTLICLMDKNGLTISCDDGRTIKINDEIGFCGYDAQGVPVYWSNADEFHMKKCVVTNEVTISSRIKFLPITTDTNTGIGVVAMA
jgi:phage minor structural protein